MRRVGILIIAALALSLTPAMPGRSTPTAEAASSDIIAVVIEGTGFGHGRGMSQWGAYGWAVDFGWSWGQILDHYYGGTVMGDIDVNDMMSVRLQPMDNQTAVGLVSHGLGVTWNGITYPSMRAIQAPGGYFDIYVSSGLTCAADVWVGNTAGTAGATFTTQNGDAPWMAAEQAIGVCQPNGSVIHYRGSIDVVAPEGVRVVNRLRTEDYLRGVVPREVAATWANAGGGAGANAVRAQAVAARSYALVQNRYAYAKTCDTTACQAYGGAGYRANATAGHEAREHPLTDAAIAETAGKVRKWPASGAIVSTEFSASNGPRTAGGAFPPVDDWGDGTVNNPNHRWTRVLDAATLASTYGLGSLTSAQMVDAASASNRQFDGIWFNDIVLTGSNGASRRIDAWTFRGSHGLPSPGFTVRVITRDTAAASVAFVGDSVASSITGAIGNEWGIVTNGSFAGMHVSALSSRFITKTPPSPSGVQAAASVPAGTDLAIVELGYNPSTNIAADIDAMMNALNARGVARVAWVNLSTTSGNASYAQFNAALSAARSRWSNLTVLDWNAAIPASERVRWLSDGVHLTATGRSQFALWLRNQASVLAPANPFRAKVTPNRALRFRVAGVGGVPVGASSVALNVTAVDPAGWGFLTVWPCGSPMPDASNVNFVSAGAVEPNSVLAKVDGTGEVCIYTSSTTHVLVDVAGWFSGGFESLVPNRIVDTRNGIGAGKVKVVPQAPLRVRVAGVGGVPVGASSVALNVTAVDPAGWGFLTVWPCGSPMPDASNVNFVSAGAVEPNSVLAKVDGTGEVCIYTSSTTHVLVDVAGWFSGGFESLVPNRIVDTRNGIGAGKVKVVPQAPLRVRVAGVGGVPVGASSVALNVTAVDPAGWGFLTVWPCGSPMPDASNVNFVSAGAVEPNSVLAKVDGTGEVCIYTSSTTHVLVDVAGWFSGGFESLVPNRIVDTRNGIGTL